MGRSFTISLAAFAATGSFLFGYDSGVMTDVIESKNFLTFFNTTQTSSIIGAINSTFSGGGRTSFAALALRLPRTNMMDSLHWLPPRGPNDGSLRTKVHDPDGGFHMHDRRDSPVISEKPGHDSCWSYLGRLGRRSHVHVRPSISSRGRPSTFPRVHNRSVPADDRSWVYYQHVCIPASPPSKNSIDLRSAGSATDPSMRPTPASSNGGFRSHFKPSLHFSW